jgi:DNA-binding NarL/FixJ family response regulator
MKKTRVLLTVEQQLHAQLLKKALASCDELEVVGEATDVIQCMMLIASTKPHVWIHSWDDGPDLTSVLSHIYSFDPSLSVIRISPDESAGFIQMQIHSLPELLKFATQTRLLVATD